jgi:hypothetical protein
MDAHLSIDAKEIKYTPHSFFWFFTWDSWNLLFGTVQMVLKLIYKSFTLFFK